MNKHKEATPATKKPRTDPPPPPPPTTNGNAQQQQQQPKQQLSKKQAKRAQDPAMVVRKEIAMAAKDNNVQAALNVYEKALSDDIPIKSDCYYTLLFLLSGGDAWEDLLSANTKEKEDTSSTVETNSMPLEERLSKAEDIMKSLMSGSGDGGGDGGEQIGDPAPPSSSSGAGPVKEMGLTSMARLAAACGKGDKAFNIALQVEKNGLTPRLRSFAPALAAYAEQGNVGKALEVDAAIAACGLELCEPEYLRLIQAITLGKGSYDQASSVFMRMQSDLTMLQPSTIATIRNYFESDLPGWEFISSTVSDEGICSGCGSKLEAVDLNEEEYQAFKEGVAALAEKQEKQSNLFKKYKEWMDKNGPYDIIIDGANVAFFGQSYFDFQQIADAVEHIKATQPGKKPLVLLHVNRAQGKAAEKPKAAKLLASLSEANCLFTTPQGSNDDWYWIYAAVAAGGNGLLVSNDEMRDHIFQLLAPKYFHKWKQRHQVRYMFTINGKFVLTMPPPYTTCVQWLDCGSWVFPVADGGWFCARKQTGGEKAEKMKCFWRDKLSVSDNHFT